MKGRRKIIIKNEKWTRSEAKFEKFEGKKKLKILFSNSFFLTNQEIKNGLQVIGKIKKRKYKKGYKLSPQASERYRRRGRRRRIQKELAYDHEFS